MRQPIAGGVPGDLKNDARASFSRQRWRFAHAAYHPNAATRTPAPEPAVLGNPNPSAPVKAAEFISKQVSHATRTVYEA